MALDYRRRPSTVDEAARILTDRWETPREVVDRTGWAIDNPGQKLAAAYARRLCERRENPPGARVFEYRRLMPGADDA